MGDWLGADTQGSSSLALAKVEVVCFFSQTNNLAVAFAAEAGVRRAFLGNL
jgi:hypothetical protein